MARKRPTTAADRKVYDHVTERDGMRCRACGRYGGLAIHRHHLVGRTSTTVETVCLLCQPCHSDLHVRIGGKKLKVYGNAETRNRFGVPCGLTIEMRQGDEWITEVGR